jgi:hypothetical protein
MRTKLLLYCFSFFSLLQIAFSRLHSTTDKDAINIMPLPIKALTKELSEGYFLIYKKPYLPTKIY